MPKPRIAIVGAHGTGKTTLASRLAKELALPLITEAAREVIAERGYPGPDVKNRIDFQLAIFRKQLEREQAHVETGFVSDRSIVDNLAYWIYWGLGNTDECSKAFGTAYEHLQKFPYTDVFLMLVEGPAEDDGMRLAGCESCRYLLEELIRLLFVDFWWHRVQVPIPEILTGSPEEKLEQAVESVRCWLSVYTGTASGRVKQ